MDFLKQFIENFKELHIVAKIIIIFIIIIFFCNLLKSFATDEELENITNTIKTIEETEENENNEEEETENNTIENNTVNENIIIKNSISNNETILIDETQFNIINSNFSRIFEFLIIICSVILGQVIYLFLHFMLERRKI